MDLIHSANTVAGSGQREYLTYFKAQLSLDVVSSPPPRHSQ